ncbi:MAG: hypothetical protein J5767_12565 [Paludibacteraceae bacterium]|nr:hypothetical protein [Paludibacteraceae bacterium]
MSYYNSTGGYPPGAANDPFAPYNEKENTPKSFDLHVTQTIGSNKNFSIKTNVYAGNFDDVDYPNTDWDEVFNDSEHHTPFGLMDEYRMFVNKLFVYIEKHYPYIVSSDKNLQKYKKESMHLANEFQHYTELETIIEPV